MEMKEMNNQGRSKEKMKNAYKLAFWSFGGIFLIMLVTFIDVRCNIYADDTIPKLQYGDTTICDTTDSFDKQQIIKTKQDVENTGTTQGEMTYEEMLSKEPDYIYYDTAEARREADSVDAYMEYWYTYLDTNSDGDIDYMYDRDSIDYDMGCGGKIHDSIIEWLDE